MIYRFEYYVNKRGESCDRVRLKIHKYQLLTRAIQALCRGVESLEKVNDDGAALRIECAKLFVDGSDYPVEILYPHSLDK